MIYYERIDVSEGSDFNKQVLQKSVMLPTSGIS